ncbi:unnamed protein product [Bathycoccus prasinos]
MIKLVAAKVPRRLFPSLVLIVFVFSTFFSSSRDEKHHLVVFSSLFTCCFKMKSLGVVALTCLSFSSICAHKNTQKKQAEDAEKRAAAAVKASGQEGPQKSAGEIRLAKDLAELKLEKGMSIKFPNGKNDLMYFQIEIKPSENYWQGGRFTFTFKIPDSYPHEPPKVLCDQIVYHPNLDTKGNICLNVLREDWSPVQTVTSVIFGLLFLFIDPNASDPLNSEAAKDLMQSTSNFKSNVRKAMMGGIINGVRFTKVI